MSHKIPILAVSILSLSLAGTALAAEKTPAYDIARGEAALQPSTSTSSTSKDGALVTAQQARARKQLAELIQKAKAGQSVDPGAIDALINAAR